LKSEIFVLLENIYEHFSQTIIYFDVYVSTR